MKASIAKILKKYKQWFLYTGILLLGILVGSILTGGEATEKGNTNGHDHSGESAKVASAEETVYTCSMHPSVRQNEPGQCPICGMDLIPAKDSGSSQQKDDAYSLELTKTAAKLAEIETSPVQYGEIVNEVRLPGRIAVDERQINSVSAQFPGRIEKLFVNFTGQKVEKGEKLASVYSSQLITAQKELLEAAQYREQQPGIYRAARQKLKNWKLSEAQIDDIVQSGEVRTTLPILSPVAGYVLERRVNKEEHVNTGSVLYEVADLSRLWVTFQVYEDKIAGLEEGDPVNFGVKAYPGEQFQAEVSFIDPVVDPATRTVTVRATVENSQNKLKPNMLATGFVESTLYAGKPRMSVPASAVLWTGTRSVVFVDQSSADQPRFAGRRIELGPKVGDRYVVLNGLQRNDQVVSHGTFKLDAAAQLSGKFSMMQQEKGSDNGTPVQLASATSGGHSGHDHSGSSTDMNMDMDMNMEDSPEPQNDVRAMKTQTSGGDSLTTHPAPEEFKQQLRAAAQEYLVLKDALVASDAQKASASAKAFLSALGKVDMKLLEYKPHMAWMEQLKTLKAEAETIQNAGELKAQRKAFSPLSNTLVKSLKTFQVAGVGYRQYCPMAKGGDGAYWISDNKAIRNPYYGNMMLKCGSVVEEL